MSAVAAAGFKSVRIPIAWDQYADDNDVISPFWIGRVREVIGYARKAGLYVIINEHWDGGWQQPTYKARDAANAKLARFWNQIATALADQDDRVLFAGTNEVMVKDDWTEPKREYCEVQNGFNQVFVDTVRATGGKNATRWLVVQSFNTNIDLAVKCNATMPRDSTPDRLMMEVHFYDPYNFTLNTSNSIWQWGKLAKDPKATEPWGNESHIDTQFDKMKTNFVDKGIPVILGEYAASLRTEHDPEQIHRNYWNLYTTYSAVQHGLVPIYWDNGYTANHHSGLFNRATGQLAYPKAAAIIVEGARAAIAARKPKAR
jgi:endoglucanase